jgi:putative flippase GtrA
MLPPSDDPNRPTRNPADTEVRREFVQFAAIGVIGFALDTVVFMLLNDGHGWSISAARAVSASLSIAATWALNRRITFAARRSRLWGTELMRYAAGQGAGLLVNLGTFALALGVAPPLRSAPVIALAFGAAAALTFNFVTARRFAFRSSSH